MPRSKEVDAWFANYDNPMKDVVQRVRDIVLAADERIDECIKWQAPTFTFNGNLASFFPKSKQHASLMFHLGAKIPGEHPRLEGSGGTSRVMKFGSVAEANAAEAELVLVVRAWCDWREGEKGNKPAKKQATPGNKAASGTKKVAKPTARGTSKAVTATPPTSRATPSKTNKKTTRSKPAAKKTSRAVTTKRPAKARTSKR